MLFYNNSIMKSINYDFIDIYIRKLAWKNMLCTFYHEVYKEICDSIDIYLRKLA